MRRALLPLILVLAGCHQEDERREARGVPQAAQAPVTGAAAEAPAPRSAPILALDAEGLRLVLESGATRLLAFGASRAQAEQAIGRAFESEPERTAIAECGAGPLEFTDYGPLTISFHDGAFAGWFADGRGAPTTLDGIGIGSSAAGIEETRTLTRMPGSTLGHEFTLGEPRADAIGGFFDGPEPDAEVTGLYAGINCFFR